MIDVDNCKRLFGATPEPISQRLTKSIAASREKFCLAAFEKIYNRLFSYILEETSAKFAAFGAPLKNFVMYPLIICQPEFLGKQLKTQ